MVFSYKGNLIISSFSGCGHMLCPQLREFYPILISEGSLQEVQLHVPCARPRACL